MSNLYERTTPSYIFKLPTGIECEIVEITFKQGAYFIIKKYHDGTLDDGMYITDDGDFAVRLTQEETNLFNTESMVHIQLRAKTSTGNVLPSVIYKVPVCNTLSKVIL